MYNISKCPKYTKIFLPKAFKYALELATIWQPWFTVASQSRLNLSNLETGQKPAADFFARISPTKKQS
jgi:hypothetical protein